MSRRPHIKNRAIIFAHYDKHGLLDPHVQFLLRRLRKHCAKLVFVSTSILPEELEKAALICDKVISRENIGYDFVSWKVGLQSLDDLSSYDEIVFVNDSCYGPVFDLDCAFKKAGAILCDIWGLTFSYELAPHLQSFFFSFRKSVIGSQDFFVFWDSVTSQADKQEIIDRYEVGMTDFFHSRGYKIHSLFGTSSLSLFERALAVFFNGRYENMKFMRVFKRFLKTKKIQNPMHIYWRTVLNRGAPFIKVELLRDNPFEVDLPRVWRFLKRCKQYDEGMARRHLERIRS